MGIPFWHPVFLVAPPPFFIPNTGIKTGIKTRMLPDHQYNPVVSLLYYKLSFIIFFYTMHWSRSPGFVLIITMHAKKSIHPSSINARTAHACTARRQQCIMTVLERQTRLNDQILPNDNVGDPCKKGSSAALDLQFPLSRKKSPGFMNEKYRL